MRSNSHESSSFTATAASEPLPSGDPPEPSPPQLVRSRSSSADNASARSTTSSQSLSERISQAPERSSAENTSPKSTASSLSVTERISQPPEGSPQERIGVLPPVEGLDVTHATPLHSSPTEISVGVAQQSDSADPKSVTSRSPPRKVSADGVKNLEEHQAELHSLKEQLFRVEAQLLKSKIKAAEHALAREKGSNSQSNSISSGLLIDVTLPVQSQPPVEPLADVADSFVEEKKNILTRSSASSPRAIPPSPKPRSVSITSLFGLCLCGRSVS